MSAATTRREVLSTNIPAFPPLFNQLADTFARMQPCAASSAPSVSSRFPPQADISLTNSAAQLSTPKADPTLPEIADFSPEFPKIFLKQAGFLPLFSIPPPLPELPARQPVSFPPAPLRAPASPHHLSPAHSPEDCTKSDTTGLESFSTFPAGLSPCFSLCSQPSSPISLCGQRAMSEACRSAGRRPIRSFSSRKRLPGKITRSPLCIPA